MDARIPSSSPAMQSPWLCLSPKTRLDAGYWARRSESRPAHGLQQAHVTQNQPPRLFPRPGLEHCTSSIASPPPIAYTHAMLALKTLARSAPRSAARLTTRAARPTPALLRPTTAFQPAWATSIPRLTASFHMSAARRQDSSGGMCASGARAEPG